MNVFDTVSYEIITYPNKTFELDFKNNRIRSFIDGRQALIQAIYLILRTERFAYPIFSANYGSELESLIGQDGLYVMTVLKRRIEEAILADDRFLEITNYSAQLQGDSVLCQFTVVSVLGRIEVEITPIYIIIDLSEFEVLSDGEQSNTYYKPPTSGYGVLPVSHQRYGE